MKYEVELRIKGYCREDIETVQKVVMSELFRNFVVTKESKLMPNDNDPGFHKFVTVKELPKNVLSNLGNSGREF